MNEPDDPGADTAMFRAFVDHGDRSAPQAAPSRLPWIAAGVALLVIAVIALLMI